MHIKVPEFKDLSNISDLSEDLKNYNCEINVPERDGVFWCVLLSSLLQIQETKLKEFLEDIAGKGTVNVVKIRKKISSYNPFLDRHAYFFDEELKEVLESFIRRGFKYRAKKYISTKIFDLTSNFESCNSKTEFWLDVLSNMLKCKITFVINSAEVSFFPKYVVDKKHSMDGCLSLLVFGTNADGICRAVSFGLSRNRAEEFQKRAGEKILKKMMLVNSKTLLDSKESKQNFILSLIKLDDSKQLEKLLKRPSYELDMLNEAGFSTDVTNLLHAAECGKLDILYMLYDYSLTKVSHSSYDAKYFDSVKNIMYYVSEQLDEAMKSSKSTLSRNLLEELSKFNIFHREICSHVDSYQSTAFKSEPELDSKRIMKVREFVNLYLQYFDNYTYLQDKNFSNICKVIDFIFCLFLLDFHLELPEHEQAKIKPILLSFVGVCLNHYEQNQNKVLEKREKYYHSLVHFANSKTVPPNVSFYSVFNLYSEIRFQNYIDLLRNLDIENNFHEAHLVMQRIVQVLNFEIEKKTFSNVSQALLLRFSEDMNDWLDLNNILYGVKSECLLLRMIISKNINIFKKFSYELQEVFEALNNFLCSSSASRIDQLETDSWRTVYANNRISLSEVSRTESYVFDVPENQNSKYRHEKKFIRSASESMISVSSEYLTMQESQSSVLCDGETETKNLDKSQILVTRRYSSILHKEEVALAQGAILRNSNTSLPIKIPCSETVEFLQTNDEQKTIQKFRFSSGFVEELKNTRKKIPNSVRDRTFEFFLDRVKSMRDLLLGKNIRFKRLWNDVKTESSKKYVRRQLVRIYTDQKSLQACIEFLLSDCHAIMSKLYKPEEEKPKIFNDLQELMHKINSPFNSMNFKNFITQKIQKNSIMESVGRIIAPYGLPNNIVNTAMDLVDDIDVLEAIYKMKVEYSSDYEKLKKCIEIEDYNEDFANLCRLIKKCPNSNHYLRLLPSAEKYQREKTV